MPIVILGEGGGGGGKELAEGFASGARLGLAKQEADRREGLYQYDLQLAQMQIESAEAERELGGLWGQALGEQAELGEAKAGLPAAQAGEMVPGPMGALMKMRNEGVGAAPEEQVSLSYLMNRFPQGLELMGRLSGDSRRRFVQDVTETAAMQMESEQMQEALERAEAAGLDPMQFQGRDSGYINQTVDREYAAEADIQTRQQKEDALAGAFFQTVDGLPNVPDSVLVRVNALRNEIERTRAAGKGTDFWHRISQAISTTEKELGMTQDSLVTLMQYAGGGGGPSGGSRPPSGGSQGSSGGSQGGGAAPGWTDTWGAGGAPQPGGPQPQPGGGQAQPEAQPEPAPPAPPPPPPSALDLTPEQSGLRERYLSGGEFTDAEFMEATKDMTDEEAEAYKADLLAGYASGSSGAVWRGGEVEELESLTLEELKAWAKEHPAKAQGLVYAEALRRKGG